MNHHTTPAENEEDEVWGRKVTVDALAIVGDGLVLVLRDRPPFEGHWALPGGFVDRHETCEAAVVRELAEETGLRGSVRRLLGVYSKPSRDEARRTVALAYEIDVVGGTLQGGDDAREARVFPLDALPPLAFDHGEMVADLKSGLREGKSKPR
ncbi:MAG: NUDIX hydrolase [Euryarchaeota archaeon]|nr:NUDIX hydrolase [Euryarchaeota archaeon]